MESFSNDSFQGATAPMQTDYEILWNIRERFQAQWTPERNFSIKDALDSLTSDRDSLRGELFEILLEIDMLRGRKVGATTPIEEYVRLFPQWKEIVETTDVKVTRDPGGRTGKVVDGYKIGRTLGEGGTACVYQASCESSDEPIAIKFLKSDDDQYKEKTLRLFENERDVSKKIPARSIFIRAYDCGQDLGDPYLAMEQVDGLDLQLWLRKNGGALNWREATRIVAKVAEGLSAVHDRHIAHRDLKPANIMLDNEGEVRVLDLGFAGSYDVSRDENKSGSKSDEFVGTLEFSPPEAKNGRDALDARSDLYCLGGTYLNLLTGKTPSKWFDPFSQDRPVVSLRKFLRRNRAKLPRRGVEILERLLEQDRDKRYSNARDVAKDLNDLLQKRRWTFAHGFAVASILFVLFVVACFVSGGIDQARLNKAIELERQGDLKDAFAITRDDVRPEKLSSSNRFDYWISLARGYVADREFDKAFGACASAFETFERLPDAERSRVRRFDPRVWEIKPFSNDAPLYENRREAIASFKEAGVKVADFFEKRSAWNATSQEDAIRLASTILYWLSRSCLAFGGDDDLTDLSQNIESRFAAVFPCVRKLCGDLLSERTRRENSFKERQNYANLAAKQYLAAANQADATNDEKIAALQETILTYDFANAPTAGLDVCEQLLKIDSNSKFARRYRGKFALLLSLKYSFNDVKRSKKDVIGDLKIAAGEDYKTDESDEERAEIWIEFALATLKSGEVSKEDCDSCLEAVKQALETNPGQYFYSFNNVEWNAFEIQQWAEEKRREFSDSDDELQNLNDQIWNDAKKAFDARLRKRTADRLEDDDDQNKSDPNESEENLEYL